MCFLFLAIMFWCHTALTEPSPPVPTLAEVHLPSILPWERGFALLMHRFLHKLTFLCEEVLSPSSGLLKPFAVTQCSHFLPLPASCHLQLQCEREIYFQKKTFEMRHALIGEKCCQYFLRDFSVCKAVHFYHNPQNVEPSSLDLRCWGRGGVQDLRRADEVTSGPGASRGRAGLEPRASVPSLSLHSCKPATPSLAPVQTCFCLTCAVS